MGMQDRDWYRDEKRQERENEWIRENRQQRPTQPRKKQDEDTELQKMLLTFSLGLNLVLGLALVYMVST